MPTNFLTNEQKETYEKFPDEIDEYDLAKYFLLDERDLEFIAKKRGLQNRFGFALQIGSIRFLGMSVADLNIIPRDIKKFVADQIEVSNLKILQDCGRRASC
ncbi:MAG: TnpA family transposase [Lentimonas sp.]|jgi:TnpA family transposase